MEEDKKNGIDIGDTDDGFFDDADKKQLQDDGFFDDGKGAQQNPQNAERNMRNAGENQGNIYRERVPVPTPKRKSVGKRIGKIFLSLGIAAAIFFCGMATTWFCLDEEIRTLINLKKTIDKEYYKDISDDEFYGALFDAINKDLLDPYSEYMTYEQYLEMEQSMAGNRSGIGVAFLVQDENGEAQMMVYRVVDNSPAQEVGLKYGDFIVGFGDSETEITDSVDFDNGLKPFLAGKADGEPFYLKVNRNGENLLIRISKEYYVESYVSYRTNKTSYGFEGDEALTYVEQGKALSCLSDDTAYIRLSQFTGNGASGFDRVMRQFKEDGMKNLVLDLRENGGGYLNYVQYIAKYFCKNSSAKNPLVTIADYGESQEYYGAAGNVYYEYFAEDSRIVVLADSGTASASECLIGCLIDYGAMGYEDICLSERNGVARTYGKGIMQTTFYVDQQKKDMVKLTTAELRWPVSGTSIHARGVLPEDGALTVAENHDGDVELINAISLLFP